MLIITEVRRLEKRLPKVHISHNTSRTLIRFTNKTRAPIRISWVNHVGKLETYDLGLQPNGTREQSTFVGHEWAIYTLAGKELGRTFASSRTIDWLVTPKGVKPISFRKKSD